MCIIFNKCVTYMAFPSFTSHKRAQQYTNFITSTYNNYSTSYSVDVRQMDFLRCSSFLRLSATRSRPKHLRSEFYSTSHWKNMFIYNIRKFRTLLTREIQTEEPPTRKCYPKVCVLKFDHWPSSKSKKVKRLPL